jgi:hypothetical protein
MSAAYDCWDNSMKTALCLLFCVSGALGAAAASNPTALKSLKLLPAESAARLAIIDGHDGAPTPARWHFVVEDSNADTGVREIVVADRQIVADRELSQFAGQISPEEVVGIAGLKVDSDAVSRLVERYAAANGLTVDSMNFQMRKDPLTGTPVWTVSCLDAQESRLGALVVDGRDGHVISHDGFAAPPPVPTKVATRREVAANRRDRRPDAAFNDPSAPPPPVYDGPADETGRRIPVRRAEPVYRSKPRPPDPVRDVVQPVRRFIHHFLPF